MEFGAGLLFRLASEGDPVTPGWTIQIYEKSDTKFERDYLMIATPPYRSWNPRYIDTSYGYSAKKAIEFQVRKFSFVPNRHEFDRFQEAVENGLFSGHTEQEAKAAVDFLISAPRCQGELEIVDARVQEAKDGPGRIEWLKFKVKLEKSKEANR